MTMDANPGTAAALQPETLVARIRAGDSGAEEQLIHTYRRGVLVITTARTHDPEVARDITQEVMIAVLKALRAGQLRESNKLSAFIQGIARNLVNNYLRTRARRAEDDLEGVELPGPNPTDELERAERQRLLRRELDTLNATDQQILLLAFVDGHSLAEVARRVGMSHEAVRARKSRAVKRLIKRFCVCVTNGSAGATGV